MQTLATREDQEEVYRAETEFERLREIRRLTRAIRQARIRGNLGAGDRNGIEYLREQLSGLRTRPAQRESARLPHRTAWPYIQRTGIS